MLRRIIPHPLLSIMLAVVWLGLVNKVTLGNLLLGLFLGLVVPMITAPYWPNRPKLRRPLTIITSPSRMLLIAGRTPGRRMPTPVVAR